jgi:GNAT superfamily N-acetyltransferase
MNLTGLHRDAAHVGMISALLARAIARLQQWLGIHIFRVNLRILPRHLVEAAAPEGISLRPLRLEDLLQASADPDLGLEPDFIRTALANGDLVVGAFKGDRVIGFLWRSAIAAPLCEDLWVRIGPRRHYAYKSLVRPSYRGMGIHIGLSRLADKFSVEKGCTGEIGFVNIANVASLGAAKSLGRRRIGYAGYVMLFGHSVSFRTPAVRELGVVIFRAEAPVTVGLVPAQG